MSALFKFIFEWATDPLSLPIHWFWEWLILLVIGETAYQVAFSKVGHMYDRGLIESRVAGKFFHWLIRLPLYVVMWAVTYGVIWTARFVIAHWKIVLISVVSLVIVVLGIIIIVNYHKKQVRKNNA